MSEIYAIEGDELIGRALAAWYRSGGRQLSNNSPDRSDAIEFEGKQYVRLVTGGGLAAVYRVRNDGMLKRLKRWPDAVNEI